ncbi:hypothetical protein XANCAGTX0491_002005 [Xanthoria calcicola]
MCTSMVEKVQTDNVVLTAFADQAIIPSRSGKVTSDEPHVRSGAKRHKNCQGCHVGPDERELTAPPQESSHLDAVVRRNSKSMQPSLRGGLRNSALHQRSLPAFLTNN